MDPRLSALVLAMLAGLVALVPSGAAGAPVLSATPSDVYLSPDGDGAADTARVPYRLKKQATVRIEVRRSDEVVRRLVRPQQAPGDHVFHWAGRGDDGSVVADGYYTIDVLAKRGTTELAHWVVSTIVDTDGDNGELLTSRPTVYPDATVVDDRVLLTYLREGWNADQDAYPGVDNGYYDRIPLRLRMSVVSARDELVWQSRRTIDGMSARFSWDGRERDGTVVRAGRYTARLVVTDAAGNVTSDEQDLRVSHRQLVPETLRVNLSPASTQRTGRVSSPFCLGCGDYCSPVDSSRFPNGLSFASCWSNWSYARFGLPLPFAAAPADTFRVTVTGGPPSPGGTGTGRLDGIVMGPGDATITTPWTAVDLGHYPYLPEQALAATWEFSSSAPDYDLASFTVEYQHYVEAS